MKLRCGKRFDTSYDNGLVDSENIITKKRLCSICSKPVSAMAFSHRHRIFCLGCETKMQLAKCRHQFQQRLDGAPQSRLDKIFSDKPIDLTDTTSPQPLEIKAMLFSYLKIAEIKDLVLQATGPCYAMDSFGAAGLKRCVVMKTLHLSWTELFGFINNKFRFAVLEDYKTSGAFCEHKRTLLRVYIDESVDVLPNGDTYTSTKMVVKIFQ